MTESEFGVLFIVLFVVLALGGCLAIEFWPTLARLFNRKETS